MAAALLACDWGTTNLRAWVLDAHGQPMAQLDFPLGVAGLAPGEAARRFNDEVRPALEATDLPAVLCGMVGSNLGWRAVPYVDCPANLTDLARAMCGVAPGVHIVPGVRNAGPIGTSDVMRGEETQVLGWLVEHPERRAGRRVVLHPGTHAKWVVVEDGRIVRFATAMTGELFAVLRHHSVLRSEAEPDDLAAFDAGVAAAGDGGALAARLFTARGRVVGDGKPAGETPSYLSGLLIGAEIAGLPGLLRLEPQDTLSLLGDAALCAWYARALTARGVPHDVFDGETAAIRGLFTLHQMATSQGGVHDAG